MPDLRNRDDDLRTTSMGLDGTERPKIANAVEQTRVHDRAYSVLESLVGIRHRPDGSPVMHIS